MKIEAVIFDFDYTLADSSAGIIDCIQTSQALMGLAVSPVEPILRTIGLSVPEILVTLNGESQRHRAEEFRQYFQKRADEVMADNTHVYPSVPHVLRGLTASGARCAIASTKFRYRIEQILARDGLRDLVHTVIGAEDVSEHKPDPACLLKALEQLQTTADRAVYVGDSLADAGAAQRADVGFIAVLTGTTTTDEFSPFQPVAVLPDVAALPGWLNDSQQRRQVPS